MAYSQEDLDRIERYIEFQKKASENLKSYGEVYGVIHELKRNAEYLNKEAERLEKKRVSVGEKLKKLEGEKLKLTKEEYTTKKKSLEQERRNLKDNLELAKKQSEEAKVLASHLAENLNKRHLINAALGTTKELTKEVFNTVVNQNKYLFEQQKGVKMSAMQMGVLANESRGFRDSIYRASLSTNQIGVSARVIGEMQATYSNELGRTIMFTQAGSIAMAELAEGTILGQENAARFAASMDEFGYSVERSRDFLEDTLNISHEMGLNAEASTKKVQEGLALAQTYNFRGGVQGVGEMALQATKFNIEMNSIAGIAESVFNPEGAIEMASKLSVLGGAWAQLGDPFSLMYKARNDMAGLTEDIVNAAAGTAQFNKETGEFEIASMELHRLREVAKITGISMDELTTSARRAARFSEIKANVSGNFDDDVMDFIASRGRFDSDSQEFKVTINGSDYFVDELHKFSNRELKAIAQERESLKERAIQAKTFDEMYDNLINQFKSTLLPGFGRFTQALTDGLVSFQDFMDDNEVLEGIADFGKWVGQMGATVAKLVTANPLGAAALVLLGKPAMWYGRGKLLGIGFNSVANVGRGVFSKGGNNNTNRGGMMGRVKDRFYGTGTGGGKIGKYARGAGRAGGVLSILGMGVDGVSNVMDDNLTGWEAAGKTLDQNKSMLIGAAIGSVIPGLGTAIGAGIGGLVDHFVIPALSNDGNRTSFSDNWGKEQQDFVSRPGEKPIPFSSADTLIGMKRGGGIDNFFNKGMGKNSSKNMNVNFTKPLKIEGNLTLNNNGKSTNIDLNDPLLIRELSKLIQERLTTELNGKISPTPI